MPVLITLTFKDIEIRLAKLAYVQYEIIYSLHYVKCVKKIRREHNGCDIYVSPLVSRSARLFRPSQVCCALSILA